MKKLIVSKRSSFNAKIASLLVLTSLGTVFMPAVAAYENPGFFHLYSAEEVKAIRSEATERISDLEKKITELRNYDEGAAELVGQRASELYAKLSGSNHMFDRFNFRDAKDVIDAADLAIAGIQRQIQAVKRRNELAHEEELQYTAKQHEYVSTFKERLFKNLRSRIDELKAFVSEVGYADRYKTEINLIKVQSEKIANDVNSDVFSGYDPELNWGEFVKNVDEHFSETKKAIERVSGLCDDLNSALGKEIEAEKIKCAKEEENKRKRELEEASKKLIISQQDGYFQAQKEALVQPLENKLRELRFCLEKSKDVSENFGDVVQLAAQQARELESAIVDMNLSDHIREDDKEIFVQNVKNYLKSAKLNIDQHCKHCDGLIAEIANAQKDFEINLVNSSRDAYDSQLYGLRCKIHEAFEIREMDEKDVQIINGMKADLLSEHDQLASDLSSMASLPEKVKFEQKLNLFLSKTDRSIDRKKAIVERFTAKMKKEEELTARHDFQKQLELLRNGELDLDDVVGGYDSLKSEFMDIDAERQEVMNTQTGNPAKGILIYGVPGVGKTTSVQAIAASLNRECVMVRRQPDNDAMRKAVQDAINRGEELSRSTGAPTYVVFDELDALAPVRTPGQASDTPAFLASVDNFDPRSGVILVATTNVLDSVDSAARRPGRFERKIEMSTPTEFDTRKILKVCLAGYKLEESFVLDEFVESLATVFRNKTGAEITRSVEIAVQERLNMSETKRRVDITLYRSDIEKAAAKLR
ncbi:MAG: AAA family ATPase [Oscillospiraceae bacterium]|nr:AAA family ATPase [Oscillospiraceae bacterium]